MSVNRQRRQRGGIARRGRQRGFSLIEVLIALVVIAFGLLGFAMLQTLSVRYAKSASQRTQATDLAYDLLDQIRANRALVDQYANINQASFANATGRGCTRPLDYVDPEKSIARWACQVRATLGPRAYAVVTRNGDDLDVLINWADAGGEVGETGNNKNGQVRVGTKL